MGRQIKPVSFGKKDQDIFEFFSAMDDFSGWVKEQGRKQMGTRNSGIDPEVMAMIERVVELKLAGYAPQQAQAQPNPIPDAFIPSLVDEVAQFF